MRSIGFVLAALLALAPSTSLARPKAKKTAAPTEVQFLGKDPHGPLAVVKDKVVATPKESACRTWAPANSLWNTVDQLGRVVGRARVTGMERYDVTNCDELVLETTSGRDGAGIFVRGDYVAMDLKAAKLTEKASKDLEELVKKRDKVVARGDNKEKDAPLSKRLITWTMPSGETFAVAGGRAVTVFRLDKGTWTVIHEILPGKDIAGTVFTPLSVLDMNGDGRPEMVIHEAGIDAYSDFTLTPNERGGFKSVEAGIHGAFA
ncbi:MAG: hypothetical protein HOW73_42145 [Polyangiaceae bacterium]|nr:hypothetical protein [Polyangiaceae bacterium]